jgi:hypothetical protein
MRRVLARAVEAELAGDVFQRGQFLNLAFLLLAHKVCRDHLGVDQEVETREVPVAALL